MSCSAKRNRQLGSCISTLVSSTNRIRPLDGSRRRRAPGLASPTGARAGATGRGGISTAGLVALAGRVGAARSRATVADSSPAARGSSDSAGASASAAFMAGALMLALDLRRARRRACSSSSRIVAGLAGGFGSGIDSGFPHCSQHLVDVAGHLEAAPFAQQGAGRSDQECRAFYAANLFAVHVLLLDDAVLGAELFVRIRDQLERQPELGLEAFVGADAVARGPDDGGAGGQEVVVAIAEVHRLRGAPRRVVLGIEIENHVATGMVGEVERAGSRF